MGYARNQSTIDHCRLKVVECGLLVDVYCRAVVLTSDKYFVQSQRSTCTHSQMSVSTRQSKAREIVQLPWTEPELKDLDGFVSKNSLYPACVVTIYQIVRDLHIKQEVIDIVVVDGLKWQRKEYFLKARTRLSGKVRLMVPFYLDAEIDLPW